MIDPIIGLAFAMQSSPGVYTLLLGSGVSRPAAIPTGWDVLEDLIRKVAQLKGEDAGAEPAAWYRQKYSENASYSRLLDDLAHTPAERNRLLRSYFEPAGNEEEGERVPTRAHRAIADLVNRGYVRVVLTTNFDRLLERALEQEGTSPSVISSPDAAEGAMPLAHAPCTVIKLHGDYLDARIKNTPTELETYDPRMDALLDQVLDEYGLVICGWSADYDDALRAALSRARSRRFTTYWCAHGELSETAERLVTNCQAQVISIASADDFFQDLRDKVVALDEISQPHPLSVKTAVATLKRWIVRPEGRLKVHDLVVTETERVFALLDQDQLNAHADYTAASLQRRLEELRALSEGLIALLAAGVYWDSGDHRSVWTRAVERVANPELAWSGYPVWLRTWRHVGMLAFYPSGIAAVAAENYGCLADLFYQVQIREPGHEPEPAVMVLNVWKPYMENIQHDYLPPPSPNQEWLAPVSQYFYQVMREPVRDLLPEDARYEDAFDRFEYLIALACGDLSDGWSPVGRFGVKARYSKTVVDRMGQELEDAGSEWAPLRGGLCEGSPERALQAHRAIVEVVKERRWTG